MILYEVNIDKEYLSKILKKIQNSILYELECDLTYEQIKTLNDYIDSLIKSIYQLEKDLFEKRLIENKINMILSTLKTSSDR